MKIFLFCHGETADKYCDYERLTPEGRYRTEKFGATHLKEVRFDRLFILPQNGMYMSETISHLGPGVSSIPKNAIEIEPPVNSEECIRRLSQSNPTSVVLVLGNGVQHYKLTRSLLGNPVSLRNCEGAIVDYDGEKFTLVEELRRP